MQQIGNIQTIIEDNPMFYIHTAQNTHHHLYEIKR